MDEEPKTIEENPWHEETINSGSILYRQCHFGQRHLVGKKRRHPNEANFSLGVGEDGLSFDWDKYVCPEKCSVIKGITTNRSGNFFNHQDYSIFKYPVDELKNVEGIIGFKHNPVFNGAPASVGLPNNKSHTLVFIDRSDEHYNQVRMNLTDFQSSNYPDLKCEIDTDEVNRIIDQIIQRLNNTEYHNFWEFTKDQLI
ncbi:hypothetical protein A0256_13700 [Mucilaginibacter sp. PAMC 26640]|nr:hypothetical protein A0256_13700 [Mucilaginibacter sp. PAMC 26640]